MSWEQASKKQGIGFAFEVPVPLPMLGHRAGFLVKDGGLEAVVLLELIPAKPRAGGLSFDGGICYHERDRFGLFALSRIEIRFACDVPTLIECDIFEAMQFGDSGEGQIVVGVLPGQAGLSLCSTYVNMLVDIQAVAFGTHWVPHVTPDDIHEISLIDWSDVEHPKGLGMIAGIPGDKRFVFGRQPGFSSADPERVRKVLESLPLKLWEELAHAAARDLTLGRHRAAVMNACLAAEGYLREVVRVNRPEVENLSQRTFKQLAERATCLPKVLGYSIGSNVAPPSVRAQYLRAAALRDSIMHTGEARYRWPPQARDSYVEIHAPAQYTAHVVEVLNLISEIDRLVTDKGGLGVVRGLHPRLESIASAELLAELEVVWSNAR